METYDTLSELLQAINKLPITPEIQSAYVKTWDVIRSAGSNTLYQNILVSISGGSDSDIVIDMIERIGYPYSKVRYIFYDTGLEFQATKNHLCYLEDRYGVNIEQVKAHIPVPLCIKKYGMPLINKRVSDYLNRLQKHNFQWEDEPFDVLYERYPNCKTALMWWCNECGEKSQLNISRNRFLKEFIIQNPPTFLISDQCCNGAKKKTSYKIEKEIQPDLHIIGVRKAEGGVRASAYKTCFDDNRGGCSYLRPVFWFKLSDKAAYDEAFEITHSECYTKYGFKRTGCACCPYGHDFEKELECAKEFEPKLYRAANGVFGVAYDYVRKYREFYKQMLES